MDSAVSKIRSTFQVEWDCEPDKQGNKIDIKAESLHCLFSFIRWWRRRSWRLFPGPRIKISGHYRESWFASRFAFCLWYFCVGCVSHAGYTRPTGHLFTSLVWPRTSNGWPWFSIISKFKRRDLAKQLFEYVCHTKRNHLNCGPSFFSPFLFHWLSGSTRPEGLDEFIEREKEYYLERSVWQWRVWDDTPPPQEREHGVQDVHSLQAPSWSVSGRRLVCSLSWISLNSCKVERKEE